MFFNKFIVGCVNAYLLGNEIFALENIIICCKNKRFLIRGVHNRQQPFVKRLNRIVTIFKTLKQKFTNLYFKIAKSRSVAWGFASRPLVFCITTLLEKKNLQPFTTLLEKKTCPLIYMFLNEFIKLYNQLFAFHS